MKFQIFNFSSKESLQRSIYFGLLFAHLITAIYWFKDKNWMKFSTENYRIACYPVFKNCYEVVFENLFLVQSVFVLYLILSFMGLIVVVLDKKKVYLLIFFFLTFLKLCLLLSRYNLMGNYHTMHLSLCAVTILSFASNSYYRLALALQYVFAGLIKLNIEWMSGASLVSYSHYLIKGFWHSLSLAYVPTLELILIWGLLSKNVILRRITLLQLIIFHLYSILIVGFYYPLIMTGLLIPIIFQEFTEQKNEIRFVTNLHLKNLAPILFILLMIFWNISSKFYPIDQAMDGNVRYLSLNMLDAKLRCQHSLIEEKPDGTIVALNIPKLATYLRIHCDALVFESFLKRLCIQNPKSRFMFYLESSRTTDKNYSLVRNYKNVCEEI